MLILQKCPILALSRIGIEGVWIRDDQWSSELIYEMHLQRKLYILHQDELAVLLLVTLLLLLRRSLWSMNHL